MNIENTYLEIISKTDEWRVFENWVQERKKENHLIARLNYVFELKGLKKVIDSRNMWMNIEVIFDSYNYTIKTPDMVQPKQYAYGKLITDEEKNELVRPMLNDIVRKIKDAK